MNIKNYKNLKKNKANFDPLTPIDFLKRTAKIFPNYISIISENKKFTWGQTFKSFQSFHSNQRLFWNFFSQHQFLRTYW